MAANHSTIMGVVAVSTGPKQITRITSGSGTYIPTVDMARCFVRLQGGGSGSFGSKAGSGGHFFEFWIRIPIAGMSYVVAASAASSAQGNITTFGNLIAFGGLAGSNNAVAGVGGYSSAVFTSAGYLSPVNSFTGIFGGGGGDGTYAGNPAGFPMTAASGQSWNNGQGAGSGGDSFYGKGGTAGNSPAAGAYGAGAGTGTASGLGGIIEVWDYGA